MGLEKQNLLQSLIERKKIFDTLGMHIMENTDFEIAERMSKLIPDVKPICTFTGSILTDESAFKKSFKYLKLFGPVYIDRAEETLETASINKIFDNLHCFTTFIQYSLDPDTKEIDKNSGVVDHFKTPKAFDEVSPMWLAHEHIHSLKDIHYSEYQDGQVFGDVIPMFLELVIADSVEKNKEKTFITNRLHLLKWECKSLSYVNDLLKKEQELYRVFATSSMQYLNSFYYSLMLYNMYKSEEDVIPLMREVLDGRKNTRTMLQELGLLNNYKEEAAKKGVASVIKRLQ